METGFTGTCLTICCLTRGQERAPLCLFKNVADDLWDKRSLPI